MYENTLKHKLGQVEKPININISFNINRKKQKEELKNTGLQKTLNYKDKSSNEQITVKTKSRNQIYRQQKLSDFTHEDLKNTSRQIGNLKKIQQQKKRKKSKRGLSDIAFNKTDSLLQYPSQFQNSIMTHRRGYTTSFMKKQALQTVQKTKNRSLKQQQSAKAKSAFSSLKRKQNKPNQTDMKKSLKQVISKIITNEWSKQSLNLFTQKRKVKSNFSAELTSKNTTGSKPKKRRSSKSEILKRQNNNSAKKRQLNDIQLKQLYENDIILQKLGNFKSMQNSLMITELDLDQDYEDLLNLKQKKINPRNKIYIKTDLSFQCINQIHQFQHQKFKKQFFNQKDHIDNLILNENGSQTHQIIENFINIFDQNQQSQQKISILDLQQKTPQISLEIRQTLNQNNFDRNALYSPQSIKTQPLLLSPINLKHQTELQDKKIQQKIFEQKELCKQKYSNKNLIQGFQKCIQSFVSQKRKNDQRKTQNIDIEPKNQNFHFTISRKPQAQKLSLLLDYLKANINNKSNEEMLTKVYELLDLNDSNFQTKKQKEENKKNSNKEHQLFNQVKIVEFEQYSSSNLNKIQHENDFYTNAIKQKLRNANEKQSLLLQTGSLKRNYESQKNDQDMMSINLETVQKALKSRIKTLQEKKQKQLQRLYEIFQEFKINEPQYIERKDKIQKWFKAQIDQISKAKKSIWKGYLQARQIISKDNWKSKSQMLNLEQHEKINFKNVSNDKSLKMIKCLSQSIFKKKNSNQNQSVNIEQKQSKQKVHFKSSLKQKSRKQKIPKKQAQIRPNESKEINEDHVVKQKDLQIKKQVNIEKNQKLQTNDKQKYSDEFIEQTDEMRKIDFFGENKQKQFNGYQNSPKLIRYQSTDKQFYSDSSLSDLSQNSFIQNIKKYQHSNDLYEYQQQKSKENIEKKLSQKQTDSSINFEQTKSPKQSKSKKIPTQQITQNQFFQVNLEDTNKKSNLNTKQNLKFRNLSEDDCEDIFQFLFLDLCIEIYQDPCHQNKIMQCINKFITKNYEMSKRKKGIKTNINVVKDYLKRLCGYLLRTNKTTLSNLNTPMGPTALEMLKYMHENQQLEDDHFQDSENVVTLIIPITIFDAFQKSFLPTIQFQHYYDDQNKQKERVHFLKNVLHIHNKAIYDALNEFLDHQRPFGIWGKPFPWKKVTSFSHIFTNIEQQEKLRKSAQKVVQSCSYVCGLMIDKEQSLIANAKVSHAYIEQIKQDRISRMLANEMIENQERWLFYDDEETQVLVETGLDIFNKLLVECIGQFVLLQKRKVKD